MEKVIKAKEEMAKGASQIKEENNVDLDENELSLEDLELTAGGRAVDLNTGKPCSFNNHN